MFSVLHTFQITSSITAVARLFFLSIVSLDANCNCTRNH